MGNKPPKLPSKTEKLVLYRNLIRSTKSYQSSNRDSILKELRVTFRENRTLQDNKIIKEKLDNANEALEMLKKYNSLYNLKDQKYVNVLPIGSKEGVQSKLQTKISSLDD